jgi:hypothetical protein
MRTGRKLASHEDIEHFRQWVEDTKRVNEALRKKGIKPRYTCMLRRGYFYEERAA